MSFTKHLTNGFRSSFEILEVRYEIGNKSSCELGNEVVHFTPNFVGKLRSSSREKFAPFGVNVLERCGYVDCELLVLKRCATHADCRLQTGRLYIVLPIRIYTIYTYTSIYTYTYTYIPIPIRSASLANRSSSLANPSASLQVCSLQVSHTGFKMGWISPDTCLKIEYNFCRV